MATKKKSKRNRFGGSTTHTKKNSRKAGRGINLLQPAEEIEAILSGPRGHKYTAKETARYRFLQTARAITFQENEERKRLAKRRAAYAKKKAKR